MKNAEEEKAAATLQLREDFDAATQKYDVDTRSPEVFRAFCLGVNMAMLTLKDMVENPERRFGEDMTPEEAADLYFTAAKDGAHAN